MRVCGDGLARSETSTWLSARAGSRDAAALAPPLRQCPGCLPPTLPCETLPCHPLPIPMDSTEPESPHQMQGHSHCPQSQQMSPSSHSMEAGMADASRDSTAATQGQACWQDVRVLSTTHVTLFAPKFSQFTWKNHRCDSCDRAWHFCHMGQKDKLFPGWMNKHPRKDSRHCWEL